MQWQCHQSSCEVHQQEGQPTVRRPHGSGDARASGAPLMITKVSDQLVHGEEEDDANQDMMMCSSPCERARHGRALASGGGGHQRAGHQQQMQPSSPGSTQALAVLSPSFPSWAKSALMRISSSWEWIDGAGDGGNRPEQWML